MMIDILVGVGAGSFLASRASDVYWYARDLYTRKGTLERINAKRAARDLPTFNSYKEYRIAQDSQWEDFILPTEVVKEVATVEVDLATVTPVKVARKRTTVK
jgi:hypothetical protein